MQFAHDAVPTLSQAIEFHRPAPARPGTLPPTQPPTTTGVPPWGGVEKN
jgi:hypothetical protein